jgi:hypothetical protein
MRGFTEGARQPPSSGLARESCVFWRFELAAKS